MNLNLLKAALIAALLLCVNAVKAQPYSIVSHNELDSCGGGFTGYIAVNQASTTLSFQTYWGDGSSSTGTLSQTFGSNYHAYALPGTYTVMHVLLHNSIPVDTVKFSVTETHCTYVSLKFFRDANSNCIWDNNEGPLSGKFMIEIDSAGVKKTIAVYGMIYRLKVKTGIPYTFKVVSTPSHISLICPANGIVTTTFTNSIVPSDILFGADCSAGSFDFSISKLKGRYRPVSWSRIELAATNFSCSPANGILTLNISSKFAPHSSYPIFPTPTSISGNTISWNLNNITSLNTQYFTVYLAPNGIVNLGDTICATASITPGNDLVPGNNSITRCDTAVSSWDPNEKEVSPEGMIFQASKLDYTIHFENLGPDTAFNIHVLDTLSEYLDVKTFEMTMSSHNAIPAVLDGANGDKIIKFDFPNIMLADSNHKEANKGFVKFSINAKSMLPPGIQIKNRAGIYFDINPVVMTNEVVNWLPVSVHEVVDSKNFSIYPNPTTTEITISTDAKLYQSAKLVNNLGQVLAEQQISKELTTMDLKPLPVGVYFIHLSGTNGTAVEKIQKQ